VVITVSGLERIIEKIQDDNKKTCEEIIEKAQAQGSLIIDEAKASAQKEEETMISEARALADRELRLAASRAEHQHKKGILTAKTEIISEIISEALQALKNMPDEQYFQAVKSLVKKYAREGKGEICLSLKDQSRLPQGFEADLNRMLEGTGKSVVINKEPISSEGGFIIRYDKIEQNCSFDSLLEASLDRIKDSLYNELFVADGSEE